MPGMNNFSEMSSVPHRDFRFRLRPPESDVSLSPDPVDWVLDMSSMAFFLAKLALMLAISSMLGSFRPWPNPEDDPKPDDVPKPDDDDPYPDEPYPDPLELDRTLGGSIFTAEIRYSLVRFNE